MVGLGDPLYKRVCASPTDAETGLKTYNPVVKRIVADKLLQLTSNEPLASADLDAAFKNPTAGSQPCVVSLRWQRSPLPG